MIKFGGVKSSLAKVENEIEKNRALNFAVSCNRVIQFSFCCLLPEKKDFLI